MRTLPYIFVIVLLAACRPPAQAPQPTATAAPNPVMLRSYNVPAGMARELAALLNRGAWTGKKTPPAFRAVASPTGQLLVTGPAGVQQGVQKVIEQVSSKSGATPARTATATYWLVVGSPEPFKDAVPNAKAQLPPVITTLQKSFPGLHFRTIERVALRSMADEGAVGAGRVMRIEQRISFRGSKVFADVTIDPPGAGHISTRLQLDKEQYVVLAATGVGEAWRQRAGIADAAAVQKQSAFYVVHVQ